MAQPEIIKDIDARIIRPISTDNAIVRFNGTTGQVQNTANTIDDNNNTIINGSLYIPAKIIGYSNQNVYNLRLGPNAENHIDLGCDGIQAKIDSSNTASTLYLNFNGGEINIGGNLTPKTDNTLNLGSNGYRFKHIYSFYLHLQGSTNPWLKLDDGSSNTWYIQSIQSGNSMGFGNGWDKSLKIDNNGNVFFPGLLQNNFRLISNESVTSGTTAGLRNTLLIFGETYGNDTAYIKTAGKLSFGDPGPQIMFNTQNSLTSGQRLALIYTDHDSIGSGNGLSLVSSESNAWFIAPTIKALTKFIGNLEGNANSANYANSAGSAPAAGGTADCTYSLDINGNSHGAYWRPYWQWDGSYFKLRFIQADGSRVDNSSRVNYADGAGNSDTVDGWHMNLDPGGWGIKPILAGTGDMVAGSTALSNGHIYLVYE